MRYACCTLLAQAGSLHDFNFFFFAQAGSLHDFNLEILRDVEVVMSHEEGPMLALAGPSFFVFFIFFCIHVEVVMSHEEGPMLVFVLSE